MKKKFFANLWLTFHSWSPVRLSITLSVYKTISIAESDLFLQKMTKKSDLLATTFFYIDTIIQGLILVHILPFIQNQ